MEKDETGKLSAEQVENWRRVLCGMIGPYALLIPVKEIQAIRDKMQEEANKRKKEYEK